MTGVARYFRLWYALGRFGLIRELAFRSNFLARVAVEVLWFGIMLIFYDTVFTQTAGEPVAGWGRHEYFFFVGCYFALGGLIETLFLSNCGEFAELVRSGDLDFYLLKPIDEQFLLSCRDIDWATAPNVLMGAGLMIFALVAMGWEFDPLNGGPFLLRAGLFLLLFFCGVALSYSFLLMLTSTSVWLVRNQSLYELWWLFTTLMRYPREIFSNTWAAPLGRLFTYVIPIMVVVNVPAHLMVSSLFDPWLVGYTLLATVALLYLSRKFFRHALRKYRSASS
jgi:ABC-2 type transport system permease protein